MEPRFGGGGGGPNKTVFGERYILPVQQSFVSVSFFLYTSLFAKAFFRRPVVVVEWSSSSLTQLFAR